MHYSDISSLFSTYYANRKNMLCTKIVPRLEAKPDRQHISQPSSHTSLPNLQSIEHVLCQWIEHARYKNPLTIRDKMVVENTSPGRVFIHHLIISSLSGAYYANGLNMLYTKTNPHLETKRLRRIHHPAKWSYITPAHLQDRRHRPSQRIVFG